MQSEVINIGDLNNEEYVFLWNPPDSEGELKFKINLEDKDKSVSSSFPSFHSSVDYVDF